MRTRAEQAPAAGVPLADFMLLTKIPIVIYYGDNIREARREAGAGAMARSLWAWPGSGGTR